MHPRSELLAIWNAAVHAVRGDHLVKQAVRVDGDRLAVGTESWPLSRLDRIEVLGAGKAVRGMAAGLESALGDEVARATRLDGWLNVPANCMEPLAHIRLHAARPAGLNEPTAEGVHGADEILRRAASLGPRDLCLCLVSGGGSALLPAPRDGVSLQELQHLTRALSAAGANIYQLNAVRKRLSRIQGGGLARACRAGWLVTLILSDVLGDPLPIIASGPTICEDEHAAALRALEVWDEFSTALRDLPAKLRRMLEDDLRAEPPPPLVSRVSHHLLANNATAVRAAAAEATRRGFQVQVLDAEASTLTADEVGVDLARHLWALALDHVPGSPPICVLSGGEPVVRLAPADRRGRGGRNQQVVLAALDWLLQQPDGEPRARVFQSVALLSGGTDGEDGPTDAAGALLDAELVQRVLAEHRGTSDPLSRNDAYSFFEAVDGLIKTLPTHTNVCDVRVAMVANW